jgi:hypothetical protein
MMLGTRRSEPLGLPATALDRRAGDRFPIEREVTYKTLNPKGEADLGCGLTINISRGGLLFATERPPSPGKRVELSVSWPVQLNGTCALKLVAQGRVVRSSPKSIAVAIEKYEFRTQGSRGLKAALKAGNKTAS